VSTAKDIICRSEELLEYAKKTDSRRVYEASKEVCFHLANLKEMREDCEAIWDQRTAEGYKRQLETAAIQLEEILSFEFSDVRKDVLRKREVLDVAGRIRDIAEGIDMDSQIFSLWNWKFFCAGVIAAKARTLLCELTGTDEMILSMLRDDLQQYERSKASLEMAVMSAMA